MRISAKRPWPRDIADESRGTGHRAATDECRQRVDPVAELPAIPLTPIPVTGRTGPRPGY